jgi:hypothetical protein
MKHIKKYLEFKDPSVIWEELAKDFRDGKVDDKDSTAAKPFNAADIKDLPKANMIIKDKSE